MKEYEKWVENPELDDMLRAELAGISDRREIEDRFFAPLSFGTAGLRGIMGAGINRMNIYTIREATQGFANLILREKEGAARGVVIGHDCRNNGRLFAEEAACVLAANGIKVNIFDAMRPTPELSFAIIRLGAMAGINITASHNAKEYNGYKVYWADGAQLSTEHAALVAEEIERTDIFKGVKTGDFKALMAAGLIEIIDPSLDEEFLNKVLSVTIDRGEIEKARDLGVVYTPFHGTGYKLLPEAFRRLGLKKLWCEPGQMVPDGNFPTVKSPNPENPEGFYLAIELAEKNNADLIIGTDPDADRVGVIARDKNDKYRPLTGNEIGILLFDYIVKTRRRMGTLPQKPMAVTTIVSTGMAEAIGKRENIPVFSTFTGFKNIAGVEAEKALEGYESIFSFEESYGYMIGDFVRDKDALGASCLILELAAYCHNKKTTLFEALEDCFERYGEWHVSRTVNIVMEGIDGEARRVEIMGELRAHPPKELDRAPVVAMTDYLPGKVTSGGEVRDIALSGSDVLQFDTARAKFIVRPSGTEPKIKVYILVAGKDREKALQIASGLEEFSLKMLK